MDYLVYADRFPKKSETMFGNKFVKRFGGKGANQAIAASKLGIDTMFIGAVGNDDDGDELVKNFENNNIDTSFIERMECGSGIAVCTIAENTNHIIVIKGANNILNTNHIDKNIAAIEQSDLIIIQNEIDIKVTKYVAKIAKKLNKIVVLNPAPAFKIDNELIESSTFIIPNEVEIMNIFEREYKTFEDILYEYPNKVVLTHGGNGVYYNDGEKIIHCNAIKSDVVDTTGAGDCFVGAFCTEFLRTNNINKSIGFAIVAAGLKVRKNGAQSSIPTLQDVRKYINFMEVKDEKDNN